MSQTPEGEDILDQATAIFEESKQDAKTFSITLTIDDAILIGSAQFFPWGNREVSEKETARTLDERFEDAITAGIKLDRKFSDRTVSVELSARDVDFINEILFNTINLNRQAGKSTRSSSLMRQLTHQGVNLAMAAIIRLNTAFVNAGGQTRPDFTRFLEGTSSNK